MYYLYIFTIFYCIISQHLRGNFCDVFFSDSNKTSDLTILCSIFPDENPSDLLHFLQLAGLYKTVSIFHEMGAHINVFGLAEVSVYFIFFSFFPFPFLAFFFSLISFFFYYRMSHRMNV